MLNNHQVLLNMAWLDTVLKDKYIGVKLAGAGFAFALSGLLIHVGIGGRVGWWFIVAGFWGGFVPGAIIHVLITLVTVLRKFVR